MELASAGCSFSSTAFPATKNLRYILFNSLLCTGFNLKVKKCYNKIEENQDEARVITKPSYSRI